jgi:NAD(P)-dependent dehydrogenase (short-subunit alcohol dehydrogenase family)
VTARRRTALVTGASSGIGAATALALAHDGFDLAVTDLRRDDLAATMAALEEASVRVVALELDLRSPAMIERAMGEATAALGPLDLLVNNAGVTLRKSALETTREEWNAVLDINLTGTFILSQAMGRHLIAAGRPGVIVNIASAHGVLGFPERAAYGVSKAAIIHLTKMLAIEWAPHGIRVNAVCPTFARTPLTERLLEDPATADELLSRIPLGRLMTPEEVAAAVVFLAGRGASGITGQALAVDGGWTAI